VVTRPQVILGIDAGTSAVKTLVLTTTGQLLGHARANVRVRWSGPRQVEQDMDELWRAVVETVRAAVLEAGAVQVAAVGVTGQGDGAWLVDIDGRPIGPAVIWLDGRATERVAAWERDGRAALVRAITGSALFPGALPVLLEELEAHDPQLLDRAVAHLNCKDWIRYRLCGVVATDASEASRTYLDVRTGQYSDELIKRLDHERFRRLLPRVLPAWAVAGRVTAAAARELGLRDGIPVATGLVDTAASGVGLGTVKPDDAYAILGTTAFAGVLREQVTMDPSVPGITLAMGGGSQVIESLAPMNGTPNLDWARGILGCQDANWTQIESMIQQAAPGAGGVLYLPYASISGERAPFLDTAASAGWLGLTVQTTPAQMLRAVYEGVALSLRECMDVLGFGAGVRICGGAAASSVVCQIVADVTGRRVVRSTAEEPGARGACTVAMVAAGCAPDLAGALRMLGDRTDTVVSDPAVGELHDRQMTVYLALRDVVRPIWPALRALRAVSTAFSPHLADPPAATAARPRPNHHDPGDCVSISDRPFLLVTAPFDPGIAQALGNAFEVELVEPSLAGRPIGEMHLDAQLARATALVCEVDVVDEATLEKAPNLRVVVSCRASPVNVDVAACTTRGIPVLTTPARNADVTADLAFTLLLMTVRHTGRAERWLRSGAWSSDDVFEPYEKFRGIGLAGRTLGILGGGAIGRRMMHRARSFGMDVLVYDPFLSADAFGDKATITGLDEVMAGSDIVTVHVPLTDSTIGLIGNRELRLMHKGAYLVNAGRAAVVQEDALVNALTKGRIAGAGLDVFWSEPVDPQHPLLALDNVTMTPHIGGASDDVITEHSRIAERGLLSWIAGERPGAVANPEVLDGAPTH